jgi:hypothetical protein
MGIVAHSVPSEKYRKKQNDTEKIRSLGRFYGKVKK